MLCSDGPTDVVTDDDIARAVRENGPHTAVTRLIGLANNRGGPDNITAVVIRAGGPARSGAVLVGRDGWRQRPVVVLGVVGVIIFAGTLIVVSRGTLDAESSAATACGGSAPRPQLPPARRPPLP